MQTAARLIQEVVRTERMIRDQFMDDYKIIIHMTDETRRKFDIVSSVIIDNSGPLTLRGHEVVIGNRNLIEIVKEI